MEFITEPLVKMDLIILSFDNIITSKILHCNQVLTAMVGMKVSTKFACNLDNVLYVKIKLKLKVLFVLNAYYALKLV